MRKALHDAGMTLNSIDGIAYTRGPGTQSLANPILGGLKPLQGMAGCLSVCSNAAKTLAAATNKPLVGVHHMVRSTFYKPRQLQRFEVRVLASPRPDTTPDDT